MNEDIQYKSMSRILITGATGNIGSEVVRYLSEAGGTNRIIAGVRNVEKSKFVFGHYPDLDYVHFDFENQDTFDNAFKETDRIFLLRPPHISDVPKYFKPLIEALKRNGVREIVFLSVQGAEKSKVIPHNKIEQLIQESGLDYIFLRPSYFMQNLTTTLLFDIETKRQIILPAGKAKFNWIDIRNIGEAAAILLDKFESFSNRAFEITGLENENFGNVTTLINSIIRNPLTYNDVNPFRFYNIKKKEGMKSGMIMVMILLHFLPRFQKEPKISEFYEELTGKKPTNLKAFIESERAKFENSNA
jgi:uncharacterized protein YbjT (DUF2867 family)